MLGLIVAGTLAFLVGFVMLISTAVSGNQKPMVTEGSVLHLQLTGGIVECAEENPMLELLGETALEEQGLDDLLKAVKVARTMIKSRVSILRVVFSVPTLLRSRSCARPW